MAWDSLYRKIVTLGRKTADFGSLTVSSSTVSFPLDKINPTSGPVAGQKCKEIFCTLEGDQIRFTLDGTDPSTGHLLNVGDSLIIENKDDIKNFKAIRVTDDATLRVSYKF